MKKNIIWFFLAAVFLSGCSSSIERLKRVGKAPDFANVELPVDHNQPSPAEKDLQVRERTRKTNSLWQPGSTSFFRDNRAWKVGDILRVVVNISDKATIGNSTQQQRTDNEAGGIGEFFGKQRAIYGALGLPKVPRGTSAAAGANNAVPSLYSGASNKNTKGSGNITRSETIQTEVAAVVRQVLSNGNLVIEGHQEIRINHELREVRVAGIIRSKDISSDNSISSDQIAEARISYGGRGTVSDMQQPRIGSQVADIISPF